MKASFTDRIKRMKNMKVLVTYLRAREKQISPKDSTAGIDRDHFLNWILKEQKNSEKPLSNEQIKLALDDCMSEDFKYIERGIRDNSIKTTTRGRRIIDSKWGWFFRFSGFLTPTIVVFTLVLSIGGIIFNAINFFHSQIAVLPTSVTTSTNAVTTASLSQPCEGTFEGVSVSGFGTGISYPSGSNPCFKNSTITNNGTDIYVRDK